MMTKNHRCPDCHATHRWRTKRCQPCLDKRGSKRRTCRHTSLAEYRAKLEMEADGSAFLRRHLLWEGLKYAAGRTMFCQSRQTCGGVILDAARAVDIEYRDPEGNEASVCVCADCYDTKRTEIQAHPGLVGVTDGRELAGHC